MVAITAPHSAKAAPHAVPAYLGRDNAFAPYTTARNWIGGHLRDAASGRTLDVVNPRFGKAMGRVVLSGAADVEAAVAAATVALPAWRTTPIKERAAVMYRFKALLERDLEELSWLLAAENGKTFGESKADIEKGIECVEFACSLPNLADGGMLEVSRGVRCEVTYEAVGIVAGIVPFNFPVMVPLWMIPNALTAGNAFICKPSETVPYGAMRIGQLLREAGLPDGIYQTVNGQREVVEALCDHPAIEALGFVGSSRVAKLVYGRSASLGKRALCLGGAKNHVLVVPDADMDLTAQNVVASSFGCAGQRCMASSLMVAVGNVQPIIDAIVVAARKIVTGRDMGAIVSAEAVVRINRYIDDAEKAGAKVLVDGRGVQVPGCEGGFWVGPTVLDRVNAGAPAACEEIFGPVLSIVRVDTLDQAIAIENASVYGNGAAIFTTSGAVARYASERLQAGMIGINIGVPVPREPFAFGGWNDSKFGHGDITGWDGYRFWSKPKKVTSKWARQSDASWMS